MITAIAQGLRRHWIMATLVTAGVVLRAITIFAYKPALMFFGDSYAYVVAAQRFQPPNDRPFGYPFVLRLLSYVGDLNAVTIVQHIVGVALAIVLYVVVIGRGARPWLAALAATPLLVDSYLIQIEHNILSETMFASLLFGAVLIVTKAELSPRWAAVAGAFLAAAALTRTVAIPIAAIFVGYLLIRKLGIKVLIGFAVALLVPIVWYMSWFASYFGSFTTSDSSGRFLYGRVAVFADCSTVDLTKAEATLCDNSAPSTRPNANFYVWASDSPVQALGAYGNKSDKIASSFSRKIILAQPLTYARYVITDFGHYFAPGKYTTRVDSPLGAWQFPTTYADPVASSAVAHNDLAGNPIQSTIEAGPALFLKSYQGVVYTQGPILLAGLVLGLLAGWIDRGRRRWDGPFIALVGIAVLAVPCLTVMFDYRYGLPAIPLFMLSGAIGLQALLQRREVRARALDPVLDDESVVEPQQRHRQRQRPRRPAWVIATLTASALAVLAAVVWAAPLARNPGFETYVSYRAELGTLGVALSKPEPVKNVLDLTEQKFQTGSIIATKTGAVAVPQRFMNAVDQAGGLVVFGAARGRETRTSYNSGLRYVTFDNGWVFWSRLGGAHAVYGDVYAAWYSPKVRARLKEPISDVETSPEGGAFQIFAGGSITQYANGSIKVTVNPNRPSTDSTQGGSLEPSRPASATTP